METGKITNLSPAILHEISSVFEARPPENAGVKCSYGANDGASPATSGPAQRRRRSGPSRLAMFESEQLTPEEEDELLKYLAFIRMRKGKK